MSKITLCLFGAHAKNVYGFLSTTACGSTLRFFFSVSSPIPIFLQPMLKRLTITNIQSFFFASFHFTDPFMPTLPIVVDRRILNDCCAATAVLYYSYRRIKNRKTEKTKSAAETAIASNNTTPIPHGERAITTISKICITYIQNENEFKSMCRRAFLIKRN